LGRSALSLSFQSQRKEKGKKKEGTGRKEAASESPALSCASYFHLEGGEREEKKGKEGCRRSSACDIG